RVVDPPTRNSRQDFVRTCLSDYLDPDVAGLIDRHRICAHTQHFTYFYGRRSAASGHSECVRGFAGKLAERFVRDRSHRCRELCALEQSQAKRRDLAKSRPPEMLVAGHWQVDSK